MTWGFIVVCGIIRASVNIRITKGHKGGHSALPLVAGYDAYGVLKFLNKELSISYMGNIDCFFTHEAESLSSALNAQLLV